MHMLEDAATVGGVRLQHQNDTSRVMKIRTLTQLERVAVAELCELAQLANGGSDATKVLGAIAAERAASIIRGESKPYEWPQDDIQAFVDLWKVDERAGFNTDD